MKLRWMDLPFFKEGVHKRIIDKIGYTNFYPSEDKIFRAFEITPLEQTRVVILAGEPYHGMDPETQLPYANGLAFSVDPRIRLFPASLRNILQELQCDIFQPYPFSGDLTPWATQGVLLLNTCLTVEANCPLSHSRVGWNRLTREVVVALSGCVWILWGKKAQEWSPEIRNPRAIIKSGHPSDLGLKNRFFGSRPFSRANEALGCNPIKWEIE